MQPPDESLIAKDDPAFIEIIRRHRDANVIADR
jgi:hypothetical protein